MTSRLDISVVIPIFNEAQTIPELWSRLKVVFGTLSNPHEVIFVDDGSRDGSGELLDQLHAQHPEVRVIHLSRTFGHQCALTAGLDHAQGRAVILMDGDLQDPPEVIPNFIAKWREGFEVVYAVRVRRHENVFKRLAFVAFYRLQARLAGIPQPLDAGVFSLMDRQVTQALKLMPERNKYLSGLRSYAGFRQVGIPVERAARRHGAPRVRIGKLFRLAFDAIFSFSTVPLRLATWFGLACSGTAFVIALVGLYYKLALDAQFLGWEYGLTSMFFLGGVQLLCLGILGEYLGRIYDEVKQRPYYLVARKVGFEQSEDDATARPSEDVPHAG